MPLRTVPGSTSQPVDDVPGCYVIENLPLESILFDRNLLGLPFKQACQTASIYFLEHFRQEILEAPDEVSELLILSKGLYYWLHNSYEQTFARNLPINFIATNRTKVEGDVAEIKVPYHNFDAATPRLIIGDTVASGATVCTALSEYMDQHYLEEVFLFSIAGARVGIKRIATFCDANGIRLHAAAGLALFGLGSNGFDLSFLHPDTHTREEYRVRAREVYGDREISVAGWDFGSQAQAPDKYRMLCWIESEMWGLDEAEVLRERMQPGDYSLVQKERDAYRYLPRRGSAPSGS